MLEVGLFKPVYWHPGRSDLPVNWERVIPEEGTVVKASISDQSLELNLAPAISVYGHHFGKRIAASVYFEIAAKYAEKVGGEIVQRATVVGCKDREYGQQLVLARYPHMPMKWERVCRGFRTVLLEGMETVEEMHHAEDPRSLKPPEQTRIWRPRPAGGF